MDKKEAVRLLSNADWAIESSLAGSGPINCFTTEDLSESEFKDAAEALMIPQKDFGQGWEYHKGESRLSGSILLERLVKEGVDFGIEFDQNRDLLHPA